MNEILTAEESIERHFQNEKGNERRKYKVEKDTRELASAKDIWRLPNDTQKDSEMITARINRT